METNRILRFHLLIFLYIGACSDDVEARSVVYPLSHGRQGASRHRSRRKLFDSDRVDPLYQGYGTHYVDTWVGCPPQRMTLIADTGSEALAWPCQECALKCGKTAHVDKPFDETKSSCFRKLDCTGCKLGDCFNNTCLVSRGYAEGSKWHAFEAVDRIRTGGDHENAPESDGFEVTFGCQYRVAGAFQTQLADGIMGLLWHDKGFIAQMYDAGKIAKRQFSLCYIKALEAKKQGTGAGAMILGDIDSRVLVSETVWAKDSQREGFYSVELERLYFRTGAGESIVSQSENERWTTTMIKVDDLNHGGVILDSGTTVTFLGEKLAKPFEEAWERITGSPFDPSQRRMSRDELLALPTLIFQMVPSDIGNDPSNPAIAGAKRDQNHPKSILVTFQPTHYMHYDPTTDTYTPSFIFGVKDGERQIFGSNFFAGKQITFDIDNKRIGFSESLCNYHELGYKNFNRTDPSRLHQSILDFASDHVKPYVPPSDSVDTSSSCSFMGCQVPLLVAFFTWMAFLALLYSRGLKIDKEEIRSLIEDAEVDGASTPKDE